MYFTPLELVRLHSGITGMTPSLMRQILQSCIDKALSLSDIFNLGETDLKALYPAMKPDVANRLINASIEDAKKALEKLETKGFKLVTFLDEEYPIRYRSYGSSMPPLLYIYGDTKLLSKPGIGFGGSRNVSKAGLYATDQLARHAVKTFGYTVISGHAKGVDMIAHQSALAAKGETILVLPEGALTFRLNENLRAYWSEAKERIVVITQFAPNEPWHVRNAMARNATAICLSKAFCIIESSDEKGGTWQAGITALEKQVPLYVLDYPDPPESALGNSKLINRGGIAIPYKDNLTLPPLDTPPTSLIQQQLF